jgi:hypothetical protein
LLAWLFVFLIERFVSINQIRTGLPTLAFPKSISLLIRSKNQHTSLGNAFGFQGFARSIRQKLTNTLLLVIRVDKGVIDVTAPAIMTSKDSTNDLPALFSHKTGVWIALQKFCNAIFAVIHAAKTFIKTRQAVP